MSSDATVSVLASPVEELEVVLGRVHELAEIPAGPGVGGRVGGDR